MAKIESTLESLANDVCTDFGVYVYDVEYKKEGSDYYLRLFIDKEGGVNIEDCENVSRALNPMLDAIDIISSPYIFEVSSPGLDRKLSRDWHFEKVIGKEIELKLFAPLDGEKQLSGILIKHENGIVTINVNGNIIDIEKSKIAIARLAVCL